MWALVWVPVGAEGTEGGEAAKAQGLLISELNRLLQAGQYSLYRVEGDEEADEAEQ